MNLPATRFGGPRGNKPRGGRNKGERNRWRKAELETMREHLQNVLDEYPGGVEGFLSDLLKDRRRGWGPFVALLRDLTPKPPAKVEADATVTVRWQDEAPLDHSGGAG